MILNLQATNVLKRTIEAADKCKIICEEGGSRSSKTWSIFQFFFLKAAEGERFTLTIARDKLTWVKATLLKDFAEMAELYHLPVTPEVNINRPEQTYYLWGSEFAFYGLDETAKLHGRKQDWTWINEVIEVSKKSFDQLEMRTTKGMILDYNPYDDSHFVFDLQKRNDVCVIKSTMLDNPFLPDTIKNKIRSYEPTPENIQQGTADLYMWEVYGLGNKARLMGAIFTNWEMVDSIPEEANLKGYGMDFGYSNDPTALVGLYLFNNEIYLDELIYEKGLINNEIADRMKLIGIEKGKPIYADSAEPKSIEEIRRMGWNIKATEKGADSVNYGIDLIKGYKVHLTKKVY